MAGLSRQHEEWLEDRGLSIELAAEKGLYSDGKNLVFPYLVNGKFYNAKVRKPGKEFVFAKSGLSLVFWNDDALSEYPMTEKAIITEGEPDALAVLQSGYGCVVSVPNRTPEQPTEGTINPFDDKRCAYLWKGGELGGARAGVGSPLMRTPLAACCKASWQSASAKSAATTCSTLTTPKTATTCSKPTASRAYAS